MVVQDVVTNVPERREGMCISGAPTPQLLEDVMGSQNVNVAAIMHAAAECENAGRSQNGYFAYA